MSLTSQLNTSHSDVSKFFADNESKSGMVECLKLLQSVKPLKQIGFKPEKPRITMPYLGIMADYLFRFYYLRNNFKIEKTIAYHGATIYSENYLFYPNNKCISSQIGAVIGAKLLQVGSSFFNGSLLDDKYGLYCATTFAVLDGFFRSGKWPGILIDMVSEYLLSIGCCIGPEDGEEPYEYLLRRKHPFSKAEIERITVQSFTEFYDLLGGDDFTSELINIIDIMKISKRTDSGLSDARMEIANGTMYNSRLIGADFDAVMIKNGNVIMTDVKTVTRKLLKKDLLQLIGYCLLWSTVDAPYDITHAGIYHGMSGDYRYLPIHEIIKMTLPSLENTENARSEFIRRITPHEEKTSTKPTVSAARSLANAQRKAAIAFSSRKL